jgi:hypothetical protein
MPREMLAPRDLFADIGWSAPGIALPIARRAFEEFESTQRG